MLVGANVDVETDAEATAPEAVDAVPPPRSRRRLGAVEIVGLLVIVGLAAGLIVSRVQLSNANSLNGQRAGAVAAARADAGDVATYSYLHLHRDFARVEAESTPSFRGSFIKSSDGLTKVLTQYKATASAKVLSAGVVSLTASRAVVILFVNQTVTNTAQTGNAPTTDNSRIEVTLQRSGNRWLLQDLKLL
jgi:Mce-associated membrane protein